MCVLGDVICVCCCSEGCDVWVMGGEGGQLFLCGGSKHCDVCVCGC